MLLFMKFRKINFARVSIFTNSPIHHIHLIRQISLYTTSQSTIPTQISLSLSLGSFKLNNQGIKFNQIVFVDVENLHCGEANDGALIDKRQGLKLEVVSFTFVQWAWVSMRVKMNNNMVAVLCVCESLYVLHLHFTTHLMGGQNNCQFLVLSHHMKIVFTQYSKLCRK